MAATTVLSFDVGIRNLAYCVARWVPPQPNDSSVEPDLIRDTSVLALGLVDVTAHLDADPHTVKNINKIPLFLLARALLRALDAHIPNLFDLLNGSLVDYVVIENQPCLKNPRMKSVQMILFSYFVHLTLCTPVRVGNVCMFQPRDKLSVYTGEPVECSLKSKYGRRKRLSVEYARRMLECHPSILETFESTKKKDDLADAYLQTLTFIRQRFFKRPRKRKGPRLVLPMLPQK